MRTVVFETSRRMVVLASGFAVLASMAVLAPASAVDGTYPTTAAAGQHAMEAALASTNATSITAGLTDAQGLLWQGSTGVRGVGDGAPTPTTMHGIGSTSKMFATTAIMQLVDQGKVGLDTPVVKYLPQFRMLSPQYRQITVRMLLDHSAGFPGSYYADAFTTKPYAKYADDVIANLAKSELKTTPGAMSVYCNDCFTLAGEVVAKVSRMPFTTYVQRNILQPLGMTNSMYVTGALPPAGAAARVVANGHNNPLEVTNVYASGGLMSTPENMLAYARMLLNKGVAGDTQVLTSGSINQMGESQLPTSLHPIEHNVWNYGLGWDTVDDLTLKAVGVRAWVKGGDTSDYHASLIVAPEVGLSAFVAGAGSFSSSTAQAIAEEILLNALAERGDIAAVPPRVGTAQPAEAVPTEEDINGIVGTYLGTPGIGQRISRGAGNTLTLERYENGTWHMGPATFTFRTDGAWWPTTPAAIGIRAATGWGRTYIVYEMPTGYGSTYGWQIIGQRMQPNGDMNKAWKDRLGAWLFIGDQPSSTTWLGHPGTVISQILGLPGYVDVMGVAPINAHQANVGTMFLQVPLMFGRDLDDLVAVTPDILRMGGFAMVRAGSVPMLARGKTPVVISSLGYPEWRVVPKASKVAVRSAQAWFMYDKDLTLLAHGTKDAAALRAPAGGMLLVFGTIGHRIDVTVAAS